MISSSVPLIDVVIVSPSLMNTVTVLIDRAAVGSHDGLPSFWIARRSPARIVTYPSGLRDWLTVASSSMPDRFSIAACAKSISRCSVSGGKFIDCSLR